MAKTKYASYKFADETEMLSVIASSGYEVENPMPTNGVMVSTTDKKDNLEYHLLDHIVENYPNTGEGWEPIMSTEVFLHSARVGNSQLPAPHLVVGNDRKYMWDYINVYFGEPSP